MNSGLPIDTQLEFFVVEGRGRNTKHLLRWTQVSLGRAELGEEAKPDRVGFLEPTVSRNHAQLEWNSRKLSYTLNHLSKTNPTLVNGAVVTGSRALQVGDEIRMGRLLLRLRETGMHKAPEVGDYFKNKQSQLQLRDRGRKVALFCRQLAVMLKSAVSLIEALEALRHQDGDLLFEQIITDISVRVQRGNRFSQALAVYPKIFSPFFCGLVAVGENTGSLHESVDHLASILEREDALNQKVRSALAYPLAVLALMTILTFVLFRTVIPQFAVFFSDFGVDLPLPTKMVMLVTAVLNSQLAWFLGAFLAAGVVHMVRQAWAIPEYRLRMYKAILVIPLVGKIIRKSALTRYCWAMQMSLSRGVNILRALELGAEASNCPQLCADLPRALDHVRDGNSLSSHLREHPDLFPMFLTQMTILAEEASDYGATFKRSADWYEQEVESDIETFKAALEPLLMTIVAVMVGGVVLSIFLPLYGLLDKLGG